MSLFRDCEKCGLPVHTKSKTCKACGGPSPWVTGTKELGPEATVSASLTTADVEHAVGALKDANVPGPHVMLQSGKPPVHLIAPPVDLNPDDAEVAAYIHKLTAPDAEAEAARVAEIEARNGPHVFLDKFSCMVGPTMAHFKAGELVKDFALLQALRAENAPMVPAALAPGMTCCPKCQNVFRVPTVVPAKRAG